MINYSQFNGKIYAYDEMHQEMTQGLPKDLAEHILSEAGSMDIGGRKYVNRTKVDKCAEKLLGIEEPSDEHVTAESIKEKELETEALKEKITQLETLISQTDSDYQKQLNALKNSLEERSMELDETNKNLQKSEEKRKEAEEERTLVCQRLQEAKNQMEINGNNHQREVNSMKNTINNLNKKLEEKAKREVEDGNCGSNTSKASLKKENRDLRKNNSELLVFNAEMADKIHQLEEENANLRENSNSKLITELGMRNTTLEKLLEQKTAQCEKSEEELRNANARNAKLREEVRIGENEKERLQQALECAKAKNREKDNSGLFREIPQYYNDEILDFIGYLAGQRLSMLPAEDASVYRRERDLCEEIIKKFTDSGMQKNIRKDIEEAIKMKFDKNSDAGLISLGLNRVSSNSHDKYVLGDEWGELAKRFTFVLAKTPSDHRAGKEAVSCLSKMLTFGSCPSEEETNK